MFLSLAVEEAFSQQVIKNGCLPRIRMLGGLLGYRPSAVRLRRS